MIDHNVDISESTVRLLVFQALKYYAVPALLPMLMDCDAVVRTAVARELQLRGGYDAFTFASELSRHTRFEHREIAAFLLGQLGTPEYPFRDASIPILIPLLQDDYFEVRGSAAAALGHLQATVAVADLIKLVADNEPYVRENVAFALARLSSDPRTASPLRRLAEDSKAEVRTWAEFGLDEAGP